LFRLLSGWWDTLVQGGITHPNWLLRRASQAAVLGGAFIQVLLNKSVLSTSVAGAQIERLWSSTRVSEHLLAPSLSKRSAGLLLRVLLMHVAATKKLSEHNDSNYREFVLCLNGRINQAVLRNLLIWQDHIFAGGAGRPIDIVLVLRDGSNDECRLFDLLSVTLALEWIRNVDVIWKSDTKVGPTPVTEQTLSDLTKLSPDLISRADGSGIRGGVKLLPEGRKRANDYLKVVLPNRFIVALGMLESADGDVEQGELDRWLRWIAHQQARDQHLGFVILNRLAPSQYRMLPDYVRVARHQGLSLQDTICLAQIADTYVGELDIFGLAALSAGRPGIYLPMDADDLKPTDLSLSDAKIVVLPRSQQSLVEMSERMTAAFEDLVAAIAR